MKSSEGANSLIFCRAIAASLVCLAADSIAAAARATEVAPGGTATWSVRVQADRDWLQVIEEVTVLSAPVPPRAEANDRPFEMRLAAEAEVLAGAMQTRGGQAINVKPLAGGRKGDYYFPGLLSPGESRFSVGYRLPYRGRALIRPGIPYSLSRIVVVIPDSMIFEAESPGLFEEGPSDALGIVQETASPKPGQSAAFRVSGMGNLTKIRGQRKREPGHTVASHSSQTVPSYSSHGDQTALPNGEAAAPSDGFPIVARSVRPLLAGVFVAVLLTGSAVLVTYKRRLRRFSA